MTPRAASPARAPRAARLGLLFLTASLLAAAPALPAFPNYTTLIPWGELNLCANCHANPAGSGPRNPFGIAFAANGRSWSPTLAALDSDGDAIPNGAELQDALGAWIAGAAQPGDPRLVSSPGRADSRPGERRLVLSEVHRTAAGDVFRAELTNRHDAPVPLGGKWLVTGTSFDPGGPVDGQVRLADALGADELAAGAVVVVDLATAGLFEWDATNGFVLLTLFEQMGETTAPGADPELWWSYGDYVEWGPLFKPYNVDARRSTLLPQWDAESSLPWSLPAGGSFEHDLAGDGLNDWYLTPVAFTLGESRPVALAEAPLGLAFPRATWQVGGMPVGLEGANIEAAQLVVLGGGTPGTHAVVQEAPARPATLEGERVLRVDRDVDPREGGAAPGPLLLRPEGAPGTFGVAAWTLDLLVERPVGAGEEAIEVGVRLGAGSDPAAASWEAVLAIGAAGEDWQLVGRVDPGSGRGDASGPVVVTLPASTIDPSADWMRARFDLLRRGDGHVVELRLSGRDGTPLLAPAAVALPDPPAPGTIARADALVQPGANGAALYVAGVSVASDAAGSVASAAIAR